MIREAIARVVEGQDLTTDEMELVMEEITNGRATPAQIASLATALRMKGETVEEITGAARVVREKAVRIDVRLEGEEAKGESSSPALPVLIDTCGTGGDGTNTFNVSTATAFVAAGAGVKVAKHGNRAVSSQCGSADVLENLGVNLDINHSDVERCIQEVGIGFLYAPFFHGAMKYAAGPRREIGIRTVFNILGPLTNPAGATAQLIGVYDPQLTEMFAGVLKNLGIKRAFVVHGFDGLDEATVTAETRVSELKDGLITTYNIDPIEIFGQTYRGEELVGGDPSDNAQITKDVLSGKDGARRKIVLLNAALALMAEEKAQDIREGIALAEEYIDSGTAIKKLQALIELSNS